METPLTEIMNLRLYANRVCRVVRRSPDGRLASAPGPVDVEMAEQHFRAHERDADANKSPECGQLGPRCHEKRHTEQDEEACEAFEEEAERRPVIHHGAAGAKVVDVPTLNFLYPKNCDLPRSRRRFSSKTRALPVHVTSAGSQASLLILR